jgi:SurA N-terminal domain/PPIC-type PPIASE domain
MLKIFRQGGLIKSLMGGIVLALIVAFMFDYRTKDAAPTNECVVEVDGTCVDVKDYNVLLRLVGPAGASTKDLKKTGFLQQTVNALVERELLLKEARRIGIGVSERAIDDELALGRVHYSWPVDAPVPRALAQGMSFPKTGAAETATYIRVRNSKTDAFDYALYRRQLQSLLRMSPKEFKELQSAEIIAARVRQTITAPVRVSAEEAFFVYDQQRTKVTARFVEAKTSWFERFAADSSEAAAKAYLAANTPAVDVAWETTKGAWSADCPLVSEIVFDYPPGADAEARAETSARAEQALQLLKDGANFELLARAFSDGDEAPVGGSLGCLSDKSGPVAADLLKVIADWKPGHASTSLTETPKGLHLLRFSGKLAAADLESKGKLHVARGLAVSQGAKDRASAFGKRLIAAVQGGKALKDAMDELVTQEVVLDDGAPSALAEKVLAAALASEAAPKFDISRAVPRGASPVPGAQDSAIASKLLALTTDDAILPDVFTTFTGIAVVQLKEKDVASREDFEKDKDAVLSNLLDEKRSEVLAAYLERLRASAKKVVINPKFNGEGPDPDKGLSTEDSG